MTPTAPEPERLPRPLMRDTRWTLALLAVTMFAWFLNLPLVLIALVTGPTAAGFAIAALAHARGVSGIGAIRVWLAIAIGVGAMSTVAAFGVLLFREPLTQFSECNARAITETAKRQCVVEYEQAYNDLLTRWGVQVP